METISLLIGLALGGGVTFIIVNLLVKTKSVSKVEYESLNTKYNEVLLNEKVLENKLQNLQEIYESLYINYNTNLEHLNSTQHKATTLEEKQKNSDLKIEELTQSLLSEIELKQKQQDDLIDQKQTISDLKSKNETLYFF